MLHLTRDEADRLDAEGQVVLFRAGHTYDVTLYPAAQSVFGDQVIYPPAEFVEAAKPCGTCEGKGTRHNLSKRWHEPCPDCLDGKRRIAVAVPCQLDLIEPCETCGGLQHVPNESDYWDVDCPDCDDGKRRIAAVVPCPLDLIEPCALPYCTGLVTVATVVVGWGPLVVHDRDALLCGDGLAVEWQPHVTVDEYGTALVCQRDTRYTDDWDEQPIALPPDIDPQSLVGQYALSVEVVEP